MSGTHDDPFDSRVAARLRAMREDLSDSTDDERDSVAAWSQRRERIYGEAVRDLHRGAAYVQGTGIASTGHLSAASAPPFDLEGFDRVEPLEGRRASWLAHSDEFDVDVVLEEAHLGRVEDWQSMERFEERISALRAVHHPGLPQYLDAFRLETDDGQRHLVALREYVPGAPLDLAGERWSDSATEVMMDDVLGALAHLHAQHPPLVHGDVRPSSIVETDEGGFILVDLALDPDSVAREAGDELFRPPELEASADASTDVYGLGATAVALMSGGIDQRGVLATLRELELPDALHGVLRRMVSPVASERFADAGEAHRAFRQAVGRPAKEQRRHAARPPVTHYAPWLSIESEGRTRRYELTCRSATSADTPCNHVTLTDDPEGVQLEFRRQSLPWLLGLGVLLYAAIPWWLLPSGALMIVTGALWIAGLALLLGMLFARLGHRTLRITAEEWSLRESPFRARSGEVGDLMGFEYRGQALLAHDGGRHDFAVARPIPTAQGRWLETYMNWRLEELHEAARSHARPQPRVEVYDAEARAE